MHERLDGRVIERISGPSWTSLRPAFDEINEALLAVSQTARGELTTIYAKYSSDETAGQPYAVVWLRKSSEIVVGLSLPMDLPSATLTNAPPRHSYAGLTRYLTIKPGDSVPQEFGEWAMSAFQAKASNK